MLGGELDGQPTALRLNVCSVGPSRRESGGEVTRSDFQPLHVGLGCVPVSDPP